MDTKDVKSCLRIILSLAMATSIIPFLITIPFFYAFIAVQFAAYIIPIISVWIFIKFKLCNLYTIPVGFALLPIFIYLYENINPTSGFGGPHMGSALVGMYYAFPFAVITFIIAIVKLLFSPKN